MELAAVGGLPAERPPGLVPLLIAAIRDCPLKAS